MSDNPPVIETHHLSRRFRRLDAVHELDLTLSEEFLEGLIELTEQEQWTIFISSHDIGEVERLADEVALINLGRLMLSESVESLLSRFRRISFTRVGENSSIEGTTN